MNTLQNRLDALQMTVPALASRAKLPADAVRAVLDNPAHVPGRDADRIRRCLGIGADGQRLVPNRTYRKQAARKKARFVMSVVQGTMGLESQGLKADSYRKLLQRTYRRLKVNPIELW